MNNETNKKLCLQIREKNQIKETNEIKMKGKKLKKDKLSQRDVSLSKSKYRLSTLSTKITK